MRQVYIVFGSAGEDPTHCEKSGLTFPANVGHVNGHEMREDVRKRAGRSGSALNGHDHQGISPFPELASTERYSPGRGSLSSQASKKAE